MRLLRSTIISVRMRIFFTVFIMAILKNMTLFLCYLWMGPNYIKASSQTAESIFGLFLISLWILAIRKKYMLPGEIFSNSEKPKNLESFLFSSLHHLSALQKESLHVWDESLNRAITSQLFFIFGTANAIAIVSLSDFVGYHRGFEYQLFYRVRRNHKPGCPHYYLAALQSDSSCYNVPRLSHTDVDICNLKPANVAEYQIALIRV